MASRPRPAFELKLFKFLVLAIAWGGSAEETEGQSLGTTSVAGYLNYRINVSTEVAVLPVHRVLIGFLIKHLLAGAAGGLLLGGLILWYDVAGLATMIFVVPIDVVALLMLFFGLFVTFGSLGMAVAVMGLGEERDSDPVEPRLPRKSGR